jgi:hypothetical protein
VRRQPDPAWIRLAGRVFAACLWLFPESLRQAHGEEMRQVFRDRCREVAGQPRRIAHLLFAEMLPDTVASAGSAQWSTGIGDPRRRHRIGLAILMVFAGWLLFQDRLSRFVLDWGFEAQYWVTNQLEARRLGAEERAVRGVADALVAQQGAESAALAAYLYRGLYTHRLGVWAAGENRGRYPGRVYRADFGPLTADGARATRAVATVLATPQPAWLATVAVQACAPSAGCDRNAAIAALVRAEPDNAYAWSQAFKAASLAGDAVGKRNALARMAGARYFDDHLGAIRSALFAATARLAPGDAHARAAVAEHAAWASRAETDDFDHDARIECLSERFGATRPTWPQSDPGVAADCLRFARLMAASDSPFNARLGWSRIIASAPSPGAEAAMARAKALERLIWRIGATHRPVSGKPGRFDVEPWNDAQWNAWAASWTPGATEADAARVLMQADGNAAAGDAR